ncbi:ROK family protein [Limibacterium fermenti]|uniref:ROK family protein n=1 Tax=Limibacterium fermenti TaxID=3229863 RepID=UPI000E9A1FAE|nr:sugar kinase [Porphyromonadaceae bacterium]
MRENLLGIDIGGTKCAVIYGIKENNTIAIVDKIIFETTNVHETINNICESTTKIMTKHQLNEKNTCAIGISCGGPLNSKKGIIQSPPNLYGWDHIPIIDIITKKFKIPTGIQNDANAGALAEWEFGAGRNTDNMVFMTCGTGLGAGLILNGKLYSGANDNAGEIGHIRLSDYGPVGYGKMGSFEGFCSGGGIAQLAKSKVVEKIQIGESVTWCRKDHLEKITAKMVADAAIAGDKLALDILKTSATYLGKGLSIIIDILNPQLIVMGGIYSRNEKLFKSHVMQIIKKEALANSYKVCNIQPSVLGEAIGDYAALSVAVNIIKRV